MKLKENLRLLRKRKGMTQTELAKQLGTSFAAISSWEKGRDTPSFDNLTKLVNYFQVSYDDLIIRDLSKEEASTNLSEQKNDSLLVGVIERMEKQLRELETFFEETADQDTLRKLIKLRDKLIKDYPNKAQELGLTDE